MTQGRTWQRWLEALAMFVKVFWQKYCHQGGGSSWPPFFLCQASYFQTNLDRRVFIKTRGVVHTLKKDVLCQQQKREKSLSYSVYDNVIIIIIYFFLPLFCTFFSQNSLPLQSSLIFNILHDYPSSVSNAEYMGMSGVVPDRWQKCHLSYHMACYSSQPICRSPLSHSPPRLPWQPSG